MKPFKPLPHHFAAYERCYSRATALSDALARLAAVSASWAHRGRSSLLSCVDTCGVLQYEADAMKRQRRLGQAVAEGEKEMAACVEACEAWSEQLLWFAVALDGVIDGSGDVCDLFPLATAALCASEAWHPPVAMPRLCFPLSPATALVDACMHMRCGLNGSTCTLSGPGTAGFLPPSSPAAPQQNSVAMHVVDPWGDAVTPSCDADVAFAVEGVRVACVCVCPGGATAVYDVEEGDVTITLSAYFCGVLVHRITVQAVVLADSAVVSSLPAPERATFLNALRSRWLPFMKYTLLYRGSRDGMTAAAFHRLCDGKGPTLTLIRSDNDCVFGGYSGVSWESPPGSARFVHGVAFLLSVCGPGGVSLFPQERFLTVALQCHAGMGPVFGPGFAVAVCARTTDPHAVFDDGSYARVIGFVDAEDRGPDVLTGQRHFTPVEIEVFAVIRQ